MGELHTHFWYVPSAGIVRSSSDPFGPGHRHTLAVGPGPVESGPPIPTQNGHVHQVNYRSSVYASGPQQSGLEQAPYPVLLPESFLTMDGSFLGEGNPWDTLGYDSAELGEITRARFDEVIARMTELRDRLRTLPASTRITYQTSTGPVTESPNETARRFTSEINMAVDRWNAHPGDEDPADVDRFMAQLDAFEADVFGPLGRDRPEAPGATDGTTTKWPLILGLGAGAALALYLVSR